MTAPKPRSEWTRQEIVSHALRSCALRIDPKHGRLKVLAEAMNRHETTISEWIALGRIPSNSANWLQRRFGKALANAAELCPPENNG